MDNLAHTLVGAALARAGLDRVSPLATPTLVIGANLPDLDVLAGFSGGLSYLDYHRGITHSVIGLVCQAPLLAGAMLVVARPIAIGTASTPSCVCGEHTPR